MVQWWCQGAEVVQVQMWCRGVGQRWSRGGAKVVPRCRSSGGAEVQVQRWCSKVVKRW